MSTSNGQNSEKDSRLASIDSIKSSHRNKQSSISRIRSFDDMGTHVEAKVLVIYTGGTIGMTRNSNNGKFVSL